MALGATTGTAHAAPATEVPPLWREFTRTSFTHPQIPYVGRAGYRAGAPRFPRRPVVADIRDFGAAPDGTTDSAPAINRAIGAAGRAGGGTVTIPPGTFRIDDVIRVGHSNVVLRGAGSSRTKLLATKNLTELIGIYGSRYGLLEGEGHGPLPPAPRRPGPPPPRRRRGPHPPGAHVRRRPGPRGLHLGRQDPRTPAPARHPPGMEPTTDHPRPGTDRIGRRGPTWSCTAPRTSYARAICTTLNARCCGSAPAAPPPTSGIGG